MDQKPNIIQFDQVCRICMKNSDDLQSIFGHPQDIPELVRDLSRVEVLENDEFPKQICLDCMTYAGNVAEFKERCIQTDRTLREYVSETSDDRKQNILKHEPELVFEEGVGIPLGPEFIKCEIDDTASEKSDEGGNTFEIAEGSDSDSDNVDHDLDGEEAKIARRIKKRSNRSTVTDDSDDEPLIAKMARGTAHDCSLCEEKFTNKSHIKFHIKSDHADEKTPVADKIRQCFYCPKAYSNYEYLKIHLNFHRRNEWICPMCGKEMKKKGKFIDHLRMHANERHYKCDICEKDFTSHKYISKHKRMHKKKGEKSSNSKYDESSESDYDPADYNKDDDDDEEEEEEDFDLSDKEESIKNSFQPNPDAPKNCPICNEAFERVIYVKFHLESEHIPLDESSPRVHHCVTCKKNYMTFEHLMSHMKLHSEKIWSCPECKKQFRRLDKYKDHQKIHQNDRTFLCVYCGKDFPTTKYMNRHLQTHMKEKVQKPEEEFECEVCGKKMKYKSNYTNHMKTHGPEHTKQIKADPDAPPKKIYLCSICGRNCGSSSNLTVHMRRHNGQAICSCSVCGKGYPRKADLVMHMRRHTGEKPHECPTCGRGFARRDKLRIHIRTHTGEKPYACPCGRAYAQKNDLKTHQKRNTCGQNFDITKLMAPYQPSICVRPKPTPPTPPQRDMNGPVPVTASVTAPISQAYNNSSSTYSVAQSSVGCNDVQSVPQSPHHDLSRMSDSVPSSPVDLMTHRYPFGHYPGSMVPNFPNPYQQPKVDMCNQ
ncbi:zinc finger protein ZFP2-like [Toxorhynchites rutilus septentrionalis]|uniref:zinc finger protein ZFP2-like n=1 Tax=Toxorhynchites rutilus septentrionalis TaxID=329112 RepID=UPI002478AD57|nr:zinc finger protein ZFP2-like [Toxorhynchites rutilus septentrionalis]